VGYKEQITGEMYITFRTIFLNLLINLSLSFNECTSYVRRLCLQVTKQPLFFAQVAGLK